MIILNALLSIGLLSVNPYAMNSNSPAYALLNSDDIQFMNEHIDEIDDDDEVLTYFMHSNANTTSASIIASGVSQWLSNHYSSYTWNMSFTNNTSSVTNGMPLSIYNDSYYSYDEINEALHNSGITNYYAGCGPNAMVGILDYFSRYMGYNEIINNPYLEDDRVQLATEVFSTVQTYNIYYEGTSIFTYPRDYMTGFNNIINSHGLTNYIHATYCSKMIRGKQSIYWNTVKSNIDLGLPVTLMTGLFSGDGDFAKHYTNIVGYETWTGTNGNQTIQKDFIIARLNLINKTALYYCDADILNDAMIALITYDCKSTSRFGAVDFAEEFVNSQGGGQYFNIEKAAPVTFLSNEHIQTYRLRTSYIENQYLVMSPNRANCGSAYLEMIFNHPVSVMTYDISLWGPNENINAQSLYLYYYDGSDWVMDESIELSNLSTNKASPNRLEYIFPSYAVGVKFYTWHTNPSGDYNRGRICLDNFVIGH